MLASRSPECFVGRHVLLRLCVPRYPPLALISLTFFVSLLMQFSRFVSGLVSSSILFDLEVLEFDSFFTWAILDSNQGPHPYQGCALTT